MKCHVYHGQNRKEVVSLGQFDVVIQYTILFPPSGGNATGIL